MRAVMNGLIALKPKTGVGHYVAELAAALNRQPGVNCSLYPGAWLHRRKLGAAKPSMGGGIRRLATWIGRAGLPWHFTAYTRTFRFDLYHEPNFVPLRCRLPTVVTVHDLSVVKFPEWHPADRVRRHERAFAAGLARADRIITVSESVRREVIAELGVAAEKVVAVLNGIGRQFVPQSARAVATVRQSLGLPEHFFLCVGTVEPRKNLGLVMRAFADLPAEVRSRCPLVLAGPWGWRSESDREFFDTVGRQAGIRHLGYIPAEALPSLYAAARVLLYPSHYEGFGLPPLEMLACGGAVIASTADAIAEVLAGHGKRVHPGDLAGWRTVMLAAATDDDFLGSLKAGGTEHARQFTWDRAAEQTADVYRSVVHPAAAR